MSGGCYTNSSLLNRNYQRLVACQNACPSSPGPSGPIGPTGAAGVGVPVGGTSGQILAKNSNANYDTLWIDNTGGGGGAGATGPSGPTGPSGINGVTGPRGVTGPSGLTGIGVPPGGLEGQVLAKNSNTNYDTIWIDGGSGPGGRGATGATGPFGATTFSWGTLSTGDGEGRLVSSNQIIKTSPTTNFNLLYYSLESYTNGSFATFQPNVFGTFAVGFTENITSTTYVQEGTSAFVCNIDGTYTITNYNAVVYPEPSDPPVSYTTDTIFSMVYDGYAIKFYTDGVLVFQLTRPIGDPLHLGVYLQTQDADVKNIHFGPVVPGPIAGNDKEFIFNDNGQAAGTSRLTYTVYEAPGAGSLNDIYTDIDLSGDYASFNLKAPYANTLNFTIPITGGDDPDYFDPVITNNSIAFRTFAVDGSAALIGEIISYKNVEEEGLGNSFVKLAGIQFRYQQYEGSYPTNEGGRIVFYRKGQEKGDYFQTMEIDASGWITFGPTGYNYTFPNTQGAAGQTLVVGPDNRQLEWGAGGGDTGATGATGPAGLPSFFRASNTSSQVVNANQLNLGSRVDYIYSVIGLDLNSTMYYSVKVPDSIDPAETYDFTFGMSYTNTDNTNFIGEFSVTLSVTSGYQAYLGNSVYKTLTGGETISVYISRTSQSFFINDVLEYQNNVEYSLNSPPYYFKLSCQGGEGIVKSFAGGVPYYTFGNAVFLPTIPGETGATGPSWFEPYSGGSSLVINGNILRITNTLDSLYSISQLNPGTGGVLFSFTTPAFDPAEDSVFKCGLSTFTAPNQSFSILEITIFSGEGSPTIILNNETYNLSPSGGDIVTVIVTGTSQTFYFNGALIQQNEFGITDPMYFVLTTIGGFPVPFPSGVPYYDFTNVVFTPCAPGPTGPTGPTGPAGNLFLKGAGTQSQIIDGNTFILTNNDDYIYSTQTFNNAVTAIYFSLVLPVLDSGEGSYIYFGLSTDNTTNDGFITEYRVRIKPTEIDLGSNIGISYTAGAKVTCIISDSVQYFYLNDVLEYENTNTSTGAYWFKVAGIPGGSLGPFVGGPYTFTYGSYTIYNPNGGGGTEGATGATGPGVPPGGTLGQILAKNSDTDYDTIWVNNTGGGTEGATGPTGPTGYEGATGLEGATGATGFEGATGPAGLGNTIPYFMDETPQTPGNISYSPGTSPDLLINAIDLNGVDQTSTFTILIALAQAGAYPFITITDGTNTATATILSGSLGAEYYTFVTSPRTINVLPGPGVYTFSYSIEGPTGPTGPEGATGPTGYEGVTGPTGYEGATGPTGLEGATGPTGFEGATGPTGFEGATGPTGPEGATGPQGATGLSVGKVTQATLGGQTIPESTDTVIQYQADIDPNGWWDDTNYRFTPTIAGYYIISASVWWNPGTSSNQTNLQIRKNGSGIAITQAPITTAAGNTQIVQRIVQLNGTTDYVDITAFTGNSGTQVINSAANGSAFYAALQ